MNRGLILLIVTSIIAVLDVVWLSLMRPFYQEGIRSILRESFLVAPGILVWLLLGVAIVFFVLPHAQSILTAALFGGLMGLVTYGVYDLTNMAVLIQWPLYITIVDMIWGSLLCSTASIAAYQLSGITTLS